MDILTSLIRTAITIVIFFGMLGLLVVIHELGHFIVARLARVRVLEFGIGFPPRARVLRSKGQTLVTLNWLPLGGFVRLEGEDGESDDPRSFVRARLPVKLIILLAGVAMNALLAVVIFTAIAWAPGQTAAIGFKTAQPDSPAASIGLVGIGPAGTTATPSDLIVAVDGQRFHDFEGAQRLIDALRARAGGSVILTVARADGSVTDLGVRLRSPADVAAGRGALGIEGVFGAVDASTFTRAPGAALDFGVAQTQEAFGLITDGLSQLGGRIVNHPTEDPGVAGPVGIAVGVGDVFWSQGAIATLRLAALLSANLALVNVLPIPPLDGGRMLVLVTKAIAGRRLSLRVERVTYVVGFGLLMAFIVWVTFFDIARNVGNGQ